jgi:hypothetical protein
MGIPALSADQATYTPAQALLTLLQDRLSGEVAAIHAAALELLSGQQGPAPSAFRMSLTVEPEAAREPRPEPTPSTRAATCWDHTYACGKSEAAHIMCTVRICMDT